MTILKMVSDSELISATRTIAAEERKITARVLAHLEELERRGLHLEMGFSSLFDFCRKDLLYSENEANARISAMRIGREIPGVAAAVETGKLNLTNLANAQSFFRQEKKAGRPVSKPELLKEIEGKSTRAVKKLLAEKSPNVAPRDTSWPISKGLTQISFAADEELMADLEKLKALWGHQGFSYAEMFKKMAKLALKKVEPAHARAERSPGAPKVVATQTNNVAANPNVSAISSSADRPETTSAKMDVLPAEFMTPKNRHIPAATKRAVWRRDHGRCTYRNAQTGRMCDSTYALEFDHLNPYGYGGSHTAENLRLLCRSHHSHLHRSG